MLETLPTDPFVTKGVEYLLVLAFLAALPWYWRVLNRPAAPREALLAGPAWFQVPEDRLYHRGHAWLRAGTEGRFRIGIDDFAGKLLGSPASIRLPVPGERLEQGARGWSLKVDDRWVPMLSPVGGEVVARNAAAMDEPDLVNRDPYDRGWLLEIEADGPQSGLDRLLRGSAAREWMRGVEAELRRQVTGAPGYALQDGGVPISGIAKRLSPTEWTRVARRFLLTE